MSARARQQLCCCLLLLLDTTRFDSAMSLHPTQRPQPRRPQPRRSCGRRKSASRKQTTAKSENRDLVSRIVEADCRRRRRAASGIKSARVSRRASSKLLQNETPTRRLDLDIYMLIRERALDHDSHLMATGAIQSVVVDFGHTIGGHRRYVAVQ